MRKSVVFLFLFVFFAVFHNSVSAQFTVVRFKDIRSIYLDEKSFNFSSSSCMKTYGKLKVVCAKHLKEREKFLATLKEWLVKYKMILVTEKDEADGILQGTLSIDDNAGTMVNRDRDKERKKGTSKDDSPSLFGDLLPGEAGWNVNSWIVNQDGDKLWMKGDWFPEPGYWWSSPAQVQGKRLAKEIQYDFEKANK